MFHCAELHCSFLPRVQVGAANVILHQFNPKKVMELIESEGVTKFLLPLRCGTCCIQEKLEKYKFQSLKLGLYGAAPMAPSLVRACQEKLGIQFIQAYGMTEMGPAITLAIGGRSNSESGFCRQGMPGHEIVIARPNDDGPSVPRICWNLGKQGKSL